MVRGVGTEEMVAVNLGCGGWVYQVNGVDGWSGLSD